MNFFEANAQRSDETWKAYQAFCHFLNQGQNRTAAATARHVETSPATISTWRKKHDWDVRIATIDRVVSGYIVDMNFESELQDAMSGINETAREILGLLRAKVKSDRDSLTISDITKAARGLHQTMHIFSYASWYGRVVEALKNLHNTEKAMEASEAFVKAQLPKPSQRTSDPDDPDDGGAK